MIEVLPKPAPQDWGHEEAAALRTLREAAGWAQPDLARRASLSVAQVRELEEGGRLLFYSAAIQAAAGRRLLALLQDDDRHEAGARAGAEGLATPGDAVPAQARLRQTPLYPLAGPEPAAAAVRSSQPLPAAVWRMATPSPAVKVQGDGPLADPVPMAVLPRARPVLSRWAQGALVLAVAGVAFQVADRSGSLDALRLAGEPPAAVPQPSASGEGAKALTDAAPAPPALREPPLAAVPARAGVAAPPTATAAGPVATPAVFAAAVRQAAPPVDGVAMAQAPAAPALPVPVIAREPARPTGMALRDACDPADREPLQVPSTARLKPGNYVHVVAERDAVVCVLDAQAQRTRLALEAGQARSVYGAPPWRLLGKDLAGVQVYFQGYKVPVASLGADYVQLIENTTQ